MGKKQEDLFENDGVSEHKTEENLFTKADRNGMLEYIEREGDRFDYMGFEVVRSEFFSKANCPAVTLKYNSVVFSVRGIRKLNECLFIHILINIEKKQMIAKPCEEDDKDSLQWSRINKLNKVVPRKITSKLFTAQLYKDMKWDIGSTIKVLGTLYTCKGEKIFVYNLVNAEMYLHLAEPSEDDPKRLKRIPQPHPPEHWLGNYGQSYEESMKQMVATFEGAPEGFVRITIPQPPYKKSKEAPKDGTG